MEEAGQLAQGILYTTPDLQRSGVGSFGLQSNCLMVLAGLKHTRIFRGASRARSHCSSSHSLISEKKHISQALCLNSYPKALIRNHPTRMQPPDTEEPKWKSTAVLPYVRGVSESLRRILAPLKIRVCFKPDIGSVQQVDGGDKV